MEKPFWKLYPRDESFEDLEVDCKYWVAMRKTADKEMTRMFLHSVKYFLKI